MPLSIQNEQAKLVFSILCLFHPKCTGTRPSVGFWHKFSLCLLPTTKRTTWGENGFNWCFNPETKAKDWSHWARFDYQLKRSLSTPSTILSTFILGELFLLFFFWVVRVLFFLLIHFPRPTICLSGRRGNANTDSLSRLISPLWKMILQYWR